QAVLFLPYLPYDVDHMPFVHTEFVRRIEWTTTALSSAAEKVDCSSAIGGLWRLSSRSPRRLGLDDSYLEGIHKYGVSADRTSHHNERIDRTADHEASSREGQRLRQHIADLPARRAMERTCRMRPMSSKPV